MDYERAGDHKVERVTYARPKFEGRACNSSKGAKRLSEWLESDYCKKKQIDRNTVARTIRAYLKTAKRKRP